MISIPVDKQLYVLAGCAVAGAMHPFGLTLAVAVLFVAAICREVYNRFTGGAFDAYDVLATVWAGALMLGWIEIAQAYV